MTGAFIQFSWYQLLTSLGRGQNWDKTGVLFKRTIFWWKLYHTILNTTKLHSTLWKFWSNTSTFSIPTLTHRFFLWPSSSGVQRSKSTTACEISLWWSASLTPARVRPFCSIPLEESSSCCNMTRLDVTRSVWTNMMCFRSCVCVLPWVSGCCEQSAISTEWHLQVSPNLLICVYNATIPHYPTPNPPKSCSVPPLIWAMAVLYCGRPQHFSTKHATSRPLQDFHAMGRQLRKSPTLAWKEPSWRVKKPYVVSCMQHHREKQPTQKPWLDCWFWCGIWRTYHFTVTLSILLIRQSQVK